MKRFIVLTGATGGIGQEILKVLLKNDKYNIIVSYRKESQLNMFLEMDDERIIPINADLSKSDDIDKLSKKIKSHVSNDGIYALINCAGLADATPLEYSSEKKARELMEVNYFAPMKLTKNLLSDLKVYSDANAVKSRVVNVASWAGVVAQPFIPFYNASKFAIMGFSESIYYDLGLDNIHVVSIIPGVTKTALLSKTTGSAFDSIKGSSKYDKYNKNFKMFSTDPSEGPFAKFLSSSKKAGENIVSILEKDNPKSRYAIASDAKFMDLIVSRLFPVKMRLGMMKRMYSLEK
ncbi:MAG: SDR family NAD(P)-dependent oxidoreductase [Firmicutes bacterium]|jgi:short-subunit dehydrogenase|nr:SDR family NAD(P)-dependent oxidoreductase [Bacillota bacterium]